MLGPTAGGAVRLANGPGPLVVAEGIETALSLASGLLAGPMRLWAALSTSGMAALRLPPLAPGAELVVASDGDRAGREAAHALAQRATAGGWRDAARRSGRRTRLQRRAPGEGGGMNAVPDPVTLTPHVQDQRQAKVAELAKLPPLDYGRPPHC